MLTVLDRFDHTDVRAYDAALGFLGRPQPGVGRPAACLSEPVKARIVAASLAGGAWSYGVPDIGQLDLAKELGARDPRIVQHVAQAAFYRTKLSDGEAYSDIRPYARSVLASLGPAAAPWKEQALAAMNGEDALGTGAAQVAAASRDPQAVRAVAKLVEAALRQTPTGPLPRERAKRMIELAYALGASGEAARPYTGLLVSLLGRDVQSFAPPFGVIDRAPSEVCRALQQIGGPDAARALAGPRCARPWFLLPG